MHMYEKPTVMRKMTSYIRIVPHIIVVEFPVCWDIMLAVGCNQEILFCTLYSLPDVIEFDRTIRAGGHVVLRI